jgi:hypothetical protein
VPATVSHALSATTPDDPSYEIRPSHWNSAHAITLNAVGSEISGAFSNAAGGVTFGLETNGKVTASAPAGGGGLTNVNVSAGTTSNNLSNLVFSNGNGVSFGLNGSTVTATVATNYLTTARASNDAVGLNSALTAGPLSWTVNSSGLSLNAGGVAGTSSGFSGNLVSGSVTLNTAGLALSLNHPAWLTTAMASNAATISAVNLSAGTTSNNLSAFVFSNANGIGFGLNGSTVTASYTQSTHPHMAVSAGTNSQNTGTVSFSNASGVSFGMDTNGVVTATVATNYLTTARASTDAIGLNTALTAGPLSWTVNSSGLSLNAGGVAGTSTGFSGNQISGSATLNTAGLALSLNHPAWLTTAMASNAATISNVNLSAGTTSANLSNFVFSNANGVSFGLNGSTVTATVATNYQSQGAYLTTARASNDAIGLNTAVTAGPLAFTINSSGFSLNASSAAGTTSGFSGNSISGSMTHNTAGLALSLNHPAWLTTAMASNAVTISNVNLSAGTTSNNLSNFVFSNANGVSFGLNGSTVTASANAGAVNQTGPNIGISNLGNTAGSTGTVSTGNVVLVGSQGIQLSQSTGAAGSNATISALMLEMSAFEPQPPTNTGFSSLGQNSIHFAPFILANPVALSRLNLFASCNMASGATASEAVSASLSFALYGRDPAATNRITRITSGSASGYQSANSNTSAAIVWAAGTNTISQSSTNGINLTGGFTGQKIATVPLTTTLTQGEYWAAVGMSTNSAGSAAAGSYSMLFNSGGMTNASFGYMGLPATNSSTYATAGLLQGVGTYSATSGAFPASVSLSEINNRSNVRPYFNLMNYATG